MWYIYADCSYSAPLQYCWLMTANDSTARSQLLLDDRIITTLPADARHLRARRLGGCASAEPRAERAGSRTSTELRAERTG